MLRLSAIFSSRRKILILWNVIQIVFLLFNHVEGIWYRPRLFISRNMNERDREREREAGRERKRGRLHCVHEWRKRRKLLGRLGHVSLYCMLTFLFSVIHYSREQRLLSSLLSPQKCGHALFHTLKRSQIKRCCWIQILQKRHIFACVSSFVLMLWQKANGVFKAL